MNPRDALVAGHLTQDRADLLTAKADLESHLRDCVTCNDDDGPACSIARDLIHEVATLEVTVGMLSQKLPDDVPGICRECACTDDRPCNPPCTWVNAKRTLCSACYAKERAS